MNDNAAHRDLDAIERAISAGRFAPYLASCANEKAQALRLYELNTRISASLYSPLQALEITLRNKFHDSLTAAYGEWWFDRPDVIWGLSQIRKIADAKLNLVKDKKALEPGRVIASLTFGFWTSCLTGPYDRAHWQLGGLEMAFREGGEKPKRGTINGMLTPLRHLRNRVAHHEPILYFNLPKHHANIITLVRWLCPTSADWAEATSTFHEAYDEALARTLLAPKDR